MSVRDPIVKGEPIEQDEKDAMFVGLFRHHVANMIKKIVHTELARAIRDLTAPHTHRDDLGGEQGDESARELLDAAPRQEFGHDAKRLTLVGGFVVRSGPFAKSRVSRADVETLARLYLRPVFVGVEHEILRAAINGDSATIRDALADRPSSLGRARGDRAGSWIVPLGDGDDDGTWNFERR